MMSLSSSSQTLRETLGPILTVLKQYGGHFTFTDSDGQQFIIAARQEFERSQPGEKQLPLPDRKTMGRTGSSMDEDTANVLDRFNREIAFSQEEAGEDEEEEPMITETQSLRVRFEPLKGDLPPELQE